jgi:hypothetical protein
MEQSNSFLPFAGAGALPIGKAGYIDALIFCYTLFLLRPTCARLCWLNPAKARRIRPDGF